MSAFSFSFDALTLPLWLVLAALALLVLSTVLAAFRTARTQAVLAAGVIVAVAALTAMWTAHTAAQRQQRLETRFAALQARAQAPGSLLACLTEEAGETVAAACARRIFATPEGTAAAMSFVATQFALLVDAARAGARRDTYLAALTDTLRGGLEHDRFGLLAHLLATREKCTAEKCDGLAVLKDPSAVQRNLEKQTFAANLTQYAAAWAHAPMAAPATDEGAAPQAPAGGANAAKAAPLPQDYVLPSSESIPAVSIMTNEPTGASAAPADAPAAAPPATTLRPVQHPARPAARPAPRPPLALTPPANPE